jgi:flavin-dependent dehydrogenase
LKKDTAHKHFDVIIIGAGPAGSSAAISLSQSGHRVALVERSGYTKIRFGETVQPEIKKLLVQLGVWAKFIEDKHLPASGIQSAWGQDELYEKNYMFNPYGNGWHLDRLKFDTMLAKAAENKGTYVFRGARIEQCIDDAMGNWTMNCAVQQQAYKLHAKFIVDASGHTSFIARKKNIERFSYDKLIGMVAFFPLEKNKTWQQEIPVSGRFTLIEAAENGWWYSAELPGSQMVIAYMTDVDLYPHSPGRALPYWQEQLSKTGYTAERADLNTPNEIPRTLSAFSSRLKNFGGSNWLAIGDAAMSFDPLSSQGICKALNSGINAAQQIHEKFTSKKYVQEMFFSKNEDDWEKYLTSRAFYYNKEDRWRSSLFWQRRQVGVNEQLRRELIAETLSHSETEKWS